MVHSAKVVQSDDQEVSLALQEEDSLKDLQTVHKPSCLPYIAQFAEYIQIFVLYPSFN